MNTEFPSKDMTHLKNVKFFYKHPFIPPCNLSTAIDLISIGHHKWPVINQRELTVTRGEFISDAKIVSKALLNLGVCKGDIVPVYTPNLYQSLVIFKASNKIGAITTFLDINMQEEKILDYLNLYKSKIIITYNKSNKFLDMVSDKTNVNKVININNDYVDSREWNKFSKNKNESFIDYRDLFTISKEKRKFNTNHHFWSSFNKPTLILYTSGSTGEPKSMVFTNKNIIASLIYLKNSTHMKSYNKESFWWMGIVPFMYPYGLNCSVMVPLMGGYGARLCPDINKDNIDYFYSKNNHVICGSPAFLEVTMKNLNKDIKTATINTFISGGDFLPASLSIEATKFFKKHDANVAICNGSGNGEILGCGTNSMGYEYKPETVGKLVIGPHYLIVNQNSLKEVKYNEPGELLVSGKHVFTGYFKNKKLTNKSFVEINGRKYYKTGNYGKLDKDRYFTMIGRASRFFINSNFNKVYCEHVQNNINQIDIVDICACVPKKDAEMLYVPAVFVVLKNKKQKNPSKYILDNLDISSSKIAVSDVLKTYEIPKYIYIIDELPRTDADKIDYEKLKAQANSY